MSSEKIRDLGTACFVTALLLLIAFFVGNLISAPKRPMRFLAKYEKYCDEKDTAKIAKLYAKSENVMAGDVVIPFEDFHAQYLYESMEDLGDKTYCIYYTAYYETTDTDNSKKKPKTVTTSYTYSGNKIYVKKSLFGYKLLKDRNGTE